MKDIEGYVPSEYLECLKNLKKQELTQKVFIFLEFTRERSTCEAMIEILKESGQEVVANELALYNKSPGLNEVSEDKLLIVQLSRQEMKGTEIYSMNKPVRGKCLIINNEMNLEKESQRFEDIFRQLHFDVEVHFKMTTAQMRNKFETLVKDPTLVGNNAFILMTISHGRDESVVGYNSTTNSADFNDILNISEIVEIFASCKALFRKPKLFFFTCCRIIRESALENLQTQQLSTTNGLGAKTLSEEIEAWQQNSAEIEKLEEDERIIPFNGINHKKDVFICYACAEGEETFYDNGYTHFGQALSHSIAQFACEKNLQTIMSRTCDFMNIKVKRMLRSAPEVRALDLRKQLFFNPGIPKKRSKN